MFKALAAEREPMSRVDTAWLRMEKPTNLMMITSVLVFDIALDVQRFKQMLSDRFLAYRRFRQRVIDLQTQAFWELDRDFDLNWHVRRVALPGDASKQELEEYVSQLASTPLDKSKPLWQFHIVENYRGGSALISRIHHCYADGLALVQVMLSLTDTRNDPVAAIKAPEKVRLKVDGGTVFQRLLEPAKHGLDQVLAASEKAANVIVEFAKDPDRALGVLKQGAGEAGEIVAELANAFMLPDDPITQFRGPLGVSKRVAWCEPLPLDLVKSIGKVLDCTVNDVLMACAAGALRQYLIDHKLPAPAEGIRATVPVNLRPLEHAKKLGNHFGLVFLDLPIGEANPLARLFAVRACMRKLKGSRQAIVSFGLLAALGLGPAMVQRPALELFSKKATAVATNVPGPQQPLYLVGAKIIEQMFWVPQSGSIGMGFSILSYNGNVHFGLIVDKKNVPVPDDIVQQFKPELEKLLLLTLMGATTIESSEALGAPEPAAGATPASKTASKQSAARKPVRSAKPAPKTRSTSIGKTRSKSIGKPISKTQSQASGGGTHAPVSQKVIRLNASRKTSPSPSASKRAALAAKAVAKALQRSRASDAS
jgi:diacylglycerol O-acyltransferase / wax synthase